MNPMPENTKAALQASADFQKLIEERAAEAKLDLQQLDDVLQANSVMLSRIFSGPTLDAFLYGQLIGWIAMNRARAIFRNGVSAETAVLMVSAEVALSLSAWQAAVMHEAEMRANAAVAEAAVGEPPKGEPEGDEFEVDEPDARQPDDAAHYGESPTAPADSPAVTD